jgi:hypothetical protein
VLYELGIFRVFTCNLPFVLVSEHLLRKPLTVIDQFHSHLEPMKFLRQETFHDQVGGHLEEQLCCAVE